MALIINILQEIGLSEKEALVYLANLEIGQATVQEISRQSGVNRATTYVILESLKQKGLASIYEKENKTHYVASDPEAIFEMFEKQKKQIEEKQKHIEGALSQLQLINNKRAGKPMVKFFEGQDGLLQCGQEFFSQYQKPNEKVVRMIYNRDLLNQILPDETAKKYREIRIKNKISSKVICETKYPLDNKIDSDRVRLLRKNMPIRADIAVYGDYIRLASLSHHPSSILIKDRAIAETLKTLFDLAHETVKTDKNQSVDS